MKQILANQKLDAIESAIKSIDTKLENPEMRTQRLEISEHTAKRQCEQLSEQCNSIKKQVCDKLKTAQERQDDCNRKLEFLTQKIQQREDEMEEFHVKNLYLEACSRRENIKFINIDDREVIADQREYRRSTPALFSSDSSKSTGVAILFNNNFNFQISKFYSDPEGRFLVCDSITNGKHLTLQNIYAPNEDKAEFFTSAFNHLLDFKCEEIIFGGDFNLGP